MDLLDLRGPDFLKVYAIFFIGAVAVGLALRRVLRGPAADPPRGIADELDPIEVAYLAGGPRLAINTALTSLYRRGALRLTAGTRSLQAVQPLPQGATPLEQQLYRFIAIEPSRTVREVHKNASLVITARRPHDLGLLLAAGQRATIAIASAMPLAAVLLLGAAKLWVGASRGRPIGYLSLIEFAGAIGVIMFLAGAPRRSATGDGVLRELQSENSALKLQAASRSSVLSPAEIALAVGLFGPAVLAGSGELDELRLAMQPPNSQGGSSCGSGCGSGGSCGGGGGGCGGGGCGGCGGGD